ncbi:MAG: glycosyltransferase family A protein [Candidatus Aenigmatarchaeota archaeon]
MVEKKNIVIVTSNFNSLKYISLSKLSLYSIFNAIESIKANDEIELLIIDNASTDGSDIIIHNLATKLSKEKDIDFEFIKLKKDLGNSFAYSYGYLLSRKRGARYVILMDNDYVILYPKVLDKLIKMAYELSSINYYSITPLSISGNRKEILNIINNFSSEDPTLEMLDYLNNFIENNKSKYSVREIGLIDDLGRVFNLPKYLTLFEFRKFTSHKKILLTGYTPLFFSLYNTKLAPIFHYLYIGGDDIISGLEHVKRGYFNIVLMDLLGGHFYSEDKYKNIYFKIRNSILVEQPTSNLYFLFKFIYTFLILIPSTIIDLDFMKNNIKIGDIKFRNNKVKQIVLGTMHGFIHYNKYREKIEKWFNENIPEKKDNKLNYLRLSFSHFPCNNFMKKMILYYLISLGSSLNYKRNKDLFLKML